jgi:HD-like signal output (HDOD) protein
MTDTTETAQRIAASIAALPPLPTTAQKILTCFGDEFIDAEAVADVVENDPGICARLLGLSNSSYFGLAEPVTNIREAISRVLGVDTVRSLVLAMAIQRSFNSKKCPAFDAQRFWTRSLQTAECCKKIASADESSDAAVRDLAYSTGLCHNLGLMALAHMEPERTHNVLQIHGRQPTPGGLRNIFVAELNTDHRIVTSELSRLWSLPELMVNAYQYRAFPELPVDGRLGLIVSGGALAVGNTDVEENQQSDLHQYADSIGLEADELQEMAMLGDRQKDRIHSLSGNMT